MAGDEHQPQQVVVDLLIVKIVKDGVELCGSVLLCGLHRAAEQAELASEPFVAADPVDGPVLGCQHEPRTGPGRDALGWPLLQSGDEGILR